jgi:2-polyprenyl-3-methyl-5-hydroxy-6-metoxy-1,4-benzoquinol methylase
MMNASSSDASRSARLDRLAAIVQCPECHGACSRAADSGGLVCERCQTPYRMRDRVLIVELAGERPEVAAEREGVLATERNAALGGLNDACDDLARATGPLKDAILALPEGDDSRYYREPGYFLNVKNSLRGFRFVTHRLRRTPGQRLLDVGADLTWSTNQFAREGLECTAIDVNHHLNVGELFQSRFDRPYDMVRVDMHAEVFRSGAFDLVVAINALHHSGDIVRMAGNLARVLSPGGRLAAVEPYCIDLSQKADFGREQIEAGINENTYLLDEWHAAFTGAGLVLEELMLSDSCNMIYRKAKPGERVEALTTMLERAHAGRLTARPLAGGAARRWTDGHALAVPVEITNLSNATWCSEGRAPIFVSYHLSRGEEGPGTMVSFDNRRTAIPDIGPGATAVCEVLVDAPEPAGMYTLTFDLVQEGICWFAQRGFRTDRLSCER